METQFTESAEDKLPKCRSADELRLFLRNQLLFEHTYRGKVDYESIRLYHQNELDLEMPAAHEVESNIILDQNWRREFVRLSEVANDNAGRVSEVTNKLKDRMAGMPE